MFNLRRSWQILSVLGACSAFAETPKINPHPNAAGVVAMRSWDATSGSGISWQQNGNYLDFSASSSGSAATWNVKDLENVSYDVNVILNSVPASSAGLKIEFTIGSETLEYTLVESAAQTNVLMGTVTPGAGDFSASIKGADAYSSTFTGVLRVVLTPSQSHRWWNPMVQKWQTKLPIHIGSQFNNNGGFFSPRPKLDDPRLDNKGFVIVTSEALKAKLTKLNDFVGHKESLGFTVYVITENDYGQGKGTIAAKNIRNWLHNNYQSKELLYALMIGDSHPLSGQVPMVALNTDIVDYQTRFDAGEDIHVGIPSDFPYVDCSGTSWDLNGDNIYDTAGDWDPVNGIDGHWDVLVGRIPYYGEDSNYGKAADLDAILAKVISYETETDIDYRYNFELNSATWHSNGALHEWAGNEYLVRVNGGHMTPDFHTHLNSDFLGTHNVGVIRSGGHGLPWWQEAGLSTAVIRDRFNNAKPNFSEIGSCDTGQIEYPENLGYMSIRYGAVGCEAPTRSIASLGVNKGTGPADFNDNPRMQLLVNSTSQGFAHWQAYMSGSVGFSGSLKMWNLFGDPSVKIFPDGVTPTYPVIVRPTNKVQRNWNGGASKPSQEYDVTNNSDTTKNVTYSTDVSWLTLDKSSESIAVGSTSTLTVTPNSSADSLPEEVSTAFIYIKDENGVTRTRQFNLRKRTPQLLAKMTFENNTGSGCPLLGTTGAEVACDQAGVVAGGISGNAYDMSHASGGLSVSNTLIPSPGSADLSVSMWVKTASLPTADTTLVNGTTFVDGGTELNLSLVNSGSQLKLSWPANHMSGAIEWKEGSFVETCTANISLTADTWHHVAFTMQRNNSFKLYWDGLEVGTFPHYGMTHNFTDLVFGKGFAGFVDEVQVTNYALSSADVTGLYNQTLSLPANIGVTGVAPHNNQPPVVVKSVLDLGDVRAEETTFQPIDLSSYVNDPEGGKLLFSCSNPVAGAWVHGSGYFYINDGVARSVASGAKVLNVSASDERGQSANFEIKFNLLPYLEYQTTVDTENGNVVYGHTPWSLNSRFQITGVVTTTGENGKNINKTAMTPVAYIDDFSADSDNMLEVYKGDSYDLSVTLKDNVSPSGWVDGQIWIDWNRDGDFNDAGEALGNIGTTHAMGAQEKTFVKTVAVPLAAATGKTRMRLRVVDSGSTLDTTITPDGPIPVNYGTAQDYTINVKVDTANTAPTINDATFAVAENVGANAAVGTVTATDSENDTLTYSITAGNAAGKFAINSATGAITTVAALDYEAVSQYVLTVEASDGKASATANVTVNVTDIIDLVDGDVIAVDLSSAGGSATKYNVISTSGGSISAGQVVEYESQQIVPEVSVTLSAVNGFNDDPKAGSWSGTAADTYYETSADDITYSPNDISLTFSGLNDAFNYNVRVYSLINDAATDTISVTDGAGTQSTTEVRSTRFAAGTLEAAGLVFSGVSTDGSGNIVVTSHTTTGWEVLNAVVIEAVAPSYAPVAVGDSATVDEDSSVVISVLANDSDANGDSLTVTAVSQGLCGSVTTNGTTVTYTPNPSCGGVDSFSYTVSDGSLTDTATVSVTINPINDAPVAVNDSAVVDEDGSVVVSVLSNDSDVDSSISVQSVTQGTNGSVTTNGTTVTYTPTADFSGVDSFTYTVTDGSLTDTATVSVTVNAVNDAPVATDFTGTVAERGESGKVVGIVVASDTENDVLTYQITSGNDDGLFAIDSNGEVTTTASLDFEVAAQHVLTVTVSDATLSGTATVTVNVTEDTLNITKGGTAIGGIHDGVDLTTLGLDDSVNHSGSAADLIDNDLSDPYDTFNHRTNNPQTHSYVGLLWSTARTDYVEAIEIDMMAYLDGGWFGVNNTSPVAGGALVDPTYVSAATVPVVQVTTDGGSTWATVADTNDYLARITGQTIGGGANPNPKLMPMVRFELATPVTGINGIRLIGSEGGTASRGFIGVAEINVFAAANVAPTVTDSTASVAENGTVGTVVETVSAVDPDGDSLSYAITAGNAGNAFAIDASGNITTAVELDYETTVSYTLTVEASDAEFTSAATVTINITNVNEAPVATDDSATVDEDTAAVVAVLANDSDVDSVLSVESVTQGTNGTVTTDGTTVTYSPAADYNGADSFTYTVTDGEFTDTATVSVTVNAVNDAPVASDDSATVDEDGSVSVTVLTNDSDIDGSISVSAVTQGSNGSVSTNGTTVTYTPSANYNGADSFTYTVTDGSLTATATVSVTVNAVNDAPVASDDSATVDEDGFVSVTVLTNDSDIDGSISVSAVTQGSNGSVSTNGTTVTYTPSANYNGADTFTYTVTDGSLTDTATVSVTVNAVNDAPVAVDDSATVDEDSSVVVSVVSNDSDTDGDALTVSAVTQGTNGTVSKDGATVTYTPNAEFFGNDSFTYTITDGSLTDTATVSVTVNQVNEDLAIGDVIAVDLSATSGNAAKYNVMDSGNGTLQAGSVVKYADGTTVADNVSVTLANVYNAGGDDSNTNWAGTAADKYYVVEADDLVYNAPHNPVTVTFSGLNDALTYNARVYAIYDDGGGATDTYTVTNGVGTKTSVMARADRMAASTLEEAGGVFNYITTDGSGNITVGVQVTAGSGWTGVSAVVLEVVAPNQAPVAVDDSATVDENSSATITVLSNDSDANSDSITLSSITQGSNGSVSTNGTTVTYTPTANFSGVDSFTYTISDGELTDTATVSVTVNAVNEAPVATDDSASVDEDGSVAITVLDNDSDIDSSISVQSVTQGANGVVTTNGITVTYTPIPNFNGVDSFTYTITDGELTDTATVSVTVNAVVDLAVVSTSAATSIEVNSATANYTITATGDEDPTVTLYYGLTNEGQTESWDNSMVIGTQSVGSFNSVLSSLIDNTNYFYTIKAVNSAGTVWGTAKAFTTQKDLTPKLYRTTVSAVGTDNWVRVNVPNYYHSMVVVATPRIADSTNAPVVTRITNIGNTSFDLIVQRADDGSATFTAVDVDVMVVEEGSYTAANCGVDMEAYKHTSTTTTAKNSYNIDQITPVNTYTTPVVLGQVMSFNDSRWSVFWSCNGNRANVPSASSIYIGKSVGEDPDKVRNDETLGYIIIESGVSTVNGTDFECGIGSDSVMGIGKSTAYTYTLSGSLTSATNAVLSAVAFDGADQGWPVLYGPTPMTATTLSMAYDEDMKNDSERNHTTEQVAYIVFE